MAGFPEMSEKDPGSVERFTINWAEVLAEPTVAETISTSVWTVPSGITKDSQSNTTTTVTLILSGGSIGQYNIQNRITTSGGQTLDKTFVVPIKEQ